MLLIARARHMLIRAHGVLRAGDEHTPIDAVC